MRMALCRAVSRYHWADGKCRTSLPTFCWGFRGIITDILNSRLGDASNIESPVVYKFISHSDPSGVFSDSITRMQNNN